MKGIRPSELFTIHSIRQFEDIALHIFRHQAENCAPYSAFISNLGIHPADVNRFEQIPYLPIEFFKTQNVLSSSKAPQITFTSSATGGIGQSRHQVIDVELYHKSFTTAFNQFYGHPASMVILALLPSYLERTGSSLIYMVDELIAKSKHPKSGYFLYDHGLLYSRLTELCEQQTPVLLIGVTYALLDFAESHSVNFPQLMVMETGGMKGKRRELVRQELHQRLCEGFGVPAIHSEYGMTELLSQAYSKGGGIFHCPAWMRVSVRDINDPLLLLGPGKTGGLNITDLANIHSCSFIATQDMGKVYNDGTFEVLGRFDNSDVRGCNLLVG